MRLETRSQRVTGVPMEPRTNFADYDPATAATRFIPAPAAASPAADLAQLLGVAAGAGAGRLRRHGRQFRHAQFLLPRICTAAWAARRFGRPVKWTCERDEAFLSDYQGRDLTVEAELALDAEGNFLGIRGTNLSNLGGHAIAFVPLQKGLGLMSSVYRIPVGYFRGRGPSPTRSRLPPTAAPAGPRRCLSIERLVDLAADRLGLDPVGAAPPQSDPARGEPYANPLGVTYDSGDYQEAMDAALALADWDGFPARRAEARQRGKLRGHRRRQLCRDHLGRPARARRNHRAARRQGRAGHGHDVLRPGPRDEFCAARHANGSACRSTASSTSPTTRRGSPAGGGSHSGRSMKLATSIIGQATDDIIDKGRKIASYLLETGEPDIEFARGQFRVAGTDREIGLFEVAAAADARGSARQSYGGRLPRISDQTLPVASFPYGTQVCEVEVDPETGEVEIVGYAAVDDVGRAINPLILHGQTHGGLAQGVGQALLEECHYDPETGQLLAASFMDYAMPRAEPFRSLTPRSAKCRRRPTGSASAPAAKAARPRRWRRDQRDRRCAHRFGVAYRDAGDPRTRLARDPRRARLRPLS